MKSGLWLRARARGSVCAMPRKPVNLGKLIFDADKAGAPKSIPVWRVERKFGDRWLGPHQLRGDEFPECRTSSGGYLKGRACKPLKKIEQIAMLCGPYSMKTSPYYDFPPREWYLNPDTTGTKMFAFPSPAAAKRWYGDRCLRDLASVGFKLREVPARKVWLSKSKRQAIFFRTDDRQKPTPPLTPAEKAKLRRMLKSSGRL